ncbi:MAG TPA: hypothetical protein PKN81_06570 [Anaerolineales bacterium]|nr:hypothetical protein [Anaerolineales bacterium]HNA55166.1 hypothetical protein [Anaerolineales bacterium]HUM25877.1 hypothetical protein [Anaerolineales bacterium]
MNAQDYGWAKNLITKRLRSFISEVFLLRMILLLIKPLFSAAGTPPSALFISTDYLAQKSFYGAFW